MNPSQIISIPVRCFVSMLLAAGFCTIQVSAQTRPAVAVPGSQGNPGMPERPASGWVYAGSDGKLIYKTTPRGDRIMDFSHAGYKGGGVPIPEVLVRETVHPSANPEEDCTARIQAAIDRVGRLTPDADGFRGAVLLAPGEYLCSEQITLPVGGVVLRGSGREPGTGGSTIRMTGGRHVAIVAAAPRTQGGNSSASLFSTRLADPYVPAGSYTFRVADASGLKAGDWIELRKPATGAWVKFMQMDDLVRDDKPQTWIKTGTTIDMRRRIAAVEGDRITVEVPLSDAFDAQYLDPPGTAVVKVGPTGLIGQVGIERLRIVSPEQAVNHTEELYMAVRLNGEDCWIRDVQIEETMNSVGVGGHRITVQRVDVLRRALHAGASKPAEFAPNAGQVLVDRCSVEGDNIWFAATGAGICGPIVMLNCDFKGTGHIEGHQRWTTGMLLDNCRLPGGGIDFKNRGSMGSGHGWGVGWAVAWNCIARTLVIQQPPGAYNWAIGTLGESTPLPRPFGSGPLLPIGVFDSPGQPVTPQSLYLAQLLERLGPDGLKAIGYNSVQEAFSGRNLTAPPEPLRTVDSVMGPDLGEFRPVGTSGVRDNSAQYIGDRALDGDPATRWIADNRLPAWLDMDMEGPVKIDALALSEPRGMENIRKYRTEGYVDSRWQVLSQGERIGARKIDRFSRVTVWKVRLIVERSDGAPTIASFSLYDTPAAGYGKQYIE